MTEKLTCDVCGKPSLWFHYKSSKYLCSLHALKRIVIEEF